MQQVEKYMRVCYHDVSVGTHVSRGRPYSDEDSLPCLRRSPRSARRAGLDKGDGGELVAELLLILAVDEAWKITAATGGSRESMTSKVITRGEAARQIEGKPDLRHRGPSTWIHIYVLFAKN